MSDDLFVPIFEKNGDSLVVRFDHCLDFMVSGENGGLYKSIKGLSFGPCPEGGLLNFKEVPSSYYIVNSDSKNTSVSTILFVYDNPGCYRSGENDENMSGRALIVMIPNVDTPEYTMVRAMVTMTEGISAAFQDAGIRSDKNQQASGFSSVKFAVARKTDSKIHIQGAGKHSLYGSLIGSTTRDAVFKYLSGMNGDVARTPESVAKQYLKDAMSWNFIPEDVGSEVIESILSLER